MLLPPRNYVKLATVTGLLPWDNYVLGEVTSATMVSPAPSHLFLMP